MSDPLMSTYARLPVAFERGAGAWLWDDQGRKYLDAVSGIAVCGLGHAHPAVTKAVCDQAARLVHTSNLYGVHRQRELAEALARLSGMEKAFFCNSGAEANEAAIKLARLYGHARGIMAPAVLVMENSFHGRTLATLSATGNRRVQAGFEPLVQGFVRVPYNDLAAVQTVAKNTPNAVAILVEPIQGEGGVLLPDEGYLEGLRTVCDQHGWLLMLDEIQSGMCRSGKWFAFQHAAVQPDVITLAKGLGNGVPIGACLARGEAAAVFKPGNHGTTFGGNPLACSAALAVISVLERHDLASRAAVLGQRMLDGFRAALSGVTGVTAIRGKGLLLGIELDRPCAGVVAEALNAGLLINVTAEKTVRLLPPLILSDEEADRVVAITSTVIKDFLAGG
ncbi:MAG: acetylornithine transaminase [Gammaproteobacteria bacterium]|nr:acetylornithine transaminase [Gammaproteobacteria bacterium]